MAGRNDADERFVIACDYLFGRGVPRSYEVAASMFEELAGEGHADAQYNLGVMYYEGEGVPHSMERAAELFRAASEQGHGPARSMYLEMVDKDLV